MKVIGLTGGIASGKTTVASILKEFGAEIIDADKVAREVVEPGKKAWIEIKSAFGDNAILPNGNINRKYLADLIFNNPQMRKVLNSIVHPKVINEINNKIDYYRQKGDTKVVVLDVPLLLETGMESMVDEVWVVAVDEETQINRMLKRDKISVEEAKNRIKSQMPLKEKLKRGDKIIEGDLTLPSLKNKLQHMWNNMNFNE